MRIEFLILYISMAAWIFPIFRQHKCNIFYFFLLLGLADPLATLLLYIFHFNNSYLFVSIAPFLFYSVGINRTLKFKINSVEVFVFSLTFLLLFIIPNLDIILLIVHLLTLIRIIYKIIIQLHLSMQINTFYLVLAFYMLSSIASLIIYLNGGHQAIILFYINLSFQILIAIFFSIFREDHPKLTYNISPVDLE